ncbi:MAG: MBL fold metallo-hydrolase [Balneolales bacterium]
MKYQILLVLLIFTASFQAFAQLSNSPDEYHTELGTLTVYPINHGSVAFTLNDKVIFVDPYGGADLFTQFDDPNLIFITDIHGDHLDSETLDALNTENTLFVVPQAVADQLERKDQLVIMDNGDAEEIMKLEVSAIPMYNLPGDEPIRHTKGRGNGYLINFGDMKVYLSGDTEDIPEMRNLEDIDIAFVCMNLPYTMDINQASDAVIDFQPSVVYPYHHRGQDIEEFKKLVDDADVDVEVKLKDWYSN